MSYVLHRDTPLCVSTIQHAMSLSFQKTYCSINIICMVPDVVSGSIYMKCSLLFTVSIKDYYL